MMGEACDICGARPAQHEGEDGLRRCLECHRERYYSGREDGPKRRSIMPLVFGGLMLTLPFGIAAKAAPSVRPLAAPAPMRAARPLPVIVNRLWRDWLLRDPATVYPPDWTRCERSSSFAGHPRFLCAASTGRNLAVETAVVVAYGARTPGGVRVGISVRITRRGD